MKNPTITTLAESLRMKTFQQSGGDYFKAPGAIDRSDNTFIKTLIKASPLALAWVPLDSGGKNIVDYLATPIKALPYQSLEATSRKVKGGIRLVVNKVRGSAISKSDKISIETEIKRAAKAFGLPPALIKAVVRAESSFRPNAVSASGAKGLMQLMPETAKELGVKNPFDIGENIRGGSRYLKRMLKLFDGDTRLALAAYNAGPGTIIRHNGEIRYRETAAYVEKVLAYSKDNASL